MIETKISNNQIDYSDSLSFMQKRVDNILNKKAKELIWFLNHNHIYTCGTSSQKNEILKITDTKIINTNRGGKITYHGPGQRIVYLMIDLNYRKKDIRKFINLIEESIIELLKTYDIKSRSFPNRVGIWVTEVNKIKLPKEEKIAAIGLRIKKWITYHGLSFNINPDLDFYKNIAACGLFDYSTTSLKKLGVNLAQKKFDELFIYIFLKKLQSF